MAITAVGSVQSVASNDNAGSANVTVPANATIAVVFWEAYTGASVNMLTATLGGVAMTLLINTTGSAVISTVGCAFLINPPTGTQAFAWDLSGTDSNGSGLFVLRFFNTASAPTTNNDVLVDWDFAQDATGSVVTIGPTVTSVTGGYVVGCVTSYPPSQVPIGAPGGSGQTVDADNLTGAGGDPLQADLAHEDTPGASSTTFTGTVAFGAVTVVSLQDFAGGGGGGAFPHHYYQQMRRRQRFAQRGAITVQGPVARAA